MDHHLSLLGITQWVSRNTAPSRCSKDPVSCKYFELMYRTKVKGVLIADCSEQVDSDSFSGLIKAMMNSIGLELHPIDPLEIYQRYEFLIIMSENPAQVLHESLAGILKIIVPSIPTLLTDPSSKRKAWLAIHKINKC